MKGEKEDNFDLTSKLIPTKTYLDKNQALKYLELWNEITEIISTPMNTKKCFAVELDWMKKFINFGLNLKE